MAEGINHIDHISQKILSKEQLLNKLSLWRFKQQKIVFTNGCFDLLHQGHLQVLAMAADQGNILIVGVNSDASVKRLKGEKRPIKDEATRAILLAALEMVDGVLIFEEDTPYNLIQLIQPDVLVKGGDYEKADIVGADIVEQRGGEVVIVPLLEGKSTSLIIKKLEETKGN